MNLPGEKATAIGGRGGGGSTRRPFAGAIASSRAS
jgi:hypothetical protein